MRWTIVTTIGKNPGDEFIRMGVERLIAVNDKEAEITLVDKENMGDMEKAATGFDKCIWAGMPVFWSFSAVGTHNFTIQWWKHMVGKFSERKQDFMVMGAGSFQRMTNIWEGVRVLDYVNAMQQLVDRSYAVTLRDDVPNIIAAYEGSSLHLPVYPCPAVFAVFAGSGPFTSYGIPRIANMMSDGSHYAVFDKQEAATWRSKCGSVIDIMDRAGFVFVVHSATEADEVRRHGGHVVHTYMGNPTKTVRFYRGVEKFFGNRIHGAIVSRSQGADTLCCGYDSRLRAVEVTGGRIVTPSTLNLDELCKWASAPPEDKPFDMAFEFDRQSELVNAFMQA